MYYIVKASLNSMIRESPVQLRVSEPVEAAQPRDAIRKADIQVNPEKFEGGCTISVLPLATDAEGKPIEHKFTEEQL